MSHCHRNRNFHNTITPWKRVLFGKPTGPQPAKHLLAFYGTRRFNTAFTRARPLSLSWARSILSTSQPHFLKIPFNIILPPKPKSFNWHISMGSAHQNTACTSPLLHTGHTSRQSLALITRIKLVRSTDHKAPRYVVFSTPLLTRTS